MLLHTLTALTLTVASMAGIPHVIPDAINSFNNGNLYFRTAGIEPEGSEFPRDPATEIRIIPDGCEMEGTNIDIELWNFVIKKTWESLGSENARFYLRAGEENLVYENSLLLFECPEETLEIRIYPEELWSLLHHALNNSSPSTGQISLEASCPGLMESSIVFIGADTPAAGTVQILLDRGRGRGRGIE